MEFRLADGTAIVPVPHDLAEAVARAVDPDNSFHVDPYTDCFVDVYRLGEFTRTIEKAIDERAALLRRIAFDQLRLRTWEPWAEQVLKARMEKDDLLTTLTQLQELCKVAKDQSEKIFILGD